MDLILKNCRLVDENGECFIKVEDGKITGISKTPIKGDDVLDVKNNYVLPGFIDPHIHFRDPGLTQKENFKTGSLAAANGGFTTVIDMPNTIPKIILSMLIASLYLYNLGNINISYFYLLNTGLIEIGRAHV